MAALRARRAAAGDGHGGRAGGPGAGRGGGRREARQAAPGGPGPVPGARRVPGPGLRLPVHAAHRPARAREPGLLHGGRRGLPAGDSPHSPACTVLSRPLTVATSIGKFTGI